MTRQRFAVIVILLIAMLAMVGNFAFADEPELGTAEDNACNPDGLMWRVDGNGCMSNWHWSCGWYLARWISAGEWFGKYPFPLDCVSVLPAPPAGVSSELAQIFCTLTASNAVFGRNYLWTFDLPEGGGIPDGTVPVGVNITGRTTLNPSDPTVYFAQDGGDATQFNDHMTETDPGTIGGGLDLTFSLVGGYAGTCGNIRP